MKYLIRKAESSRVFLFFILLILFVFSFSGANADTEDSLKLHQELEEKLSKEFEVLGMEVFHAVISMAEKNTERLSDPFIACNGRLTLTSGTAVTTSNVTAATSLYFTPYNGNKVSVYGSSRWQFLTFAEVSVAVPSTTTTPFDIFGYNNSGALALETLNWTNDTTRATAITTQDGVYVKTGDSTRRYLGTGRTTGTSGQTEDSTSKRFLWNTCNRFPRKILAAADFDDYSYTTATWRAANAETTTGATRIEFVLGLQAEPIKLLVNIGIAYNGTGPDNVTSGIGINSTTTNSSDLYGSVASPSFMNYDSHYLGIPSVGYNYAQWIEWAYAYGTNIYYDSSDAAVHRQAAMLGEMWN